MLGLMGKGTRLEGIHYRMRRSLLLIVAMRRKSPTAPSHIRIRRTHSVLWQQTEEGVLGL
jgi:hypothetical protein